MRRLILLLALAAIPAGCSKPAEKAADPVAQVRTAPVVRADLDETVTAYGQVEFDPAGLRALTAPFEAQVAQVHVRVGQSVSGRATDRDPDRQSPDPPRPRAAGS